MKVCLFLSVQVVCERSDVFASACAIARAFPIFSRRSASSRRTEKKEVTVEFITVGQDNGPLDLTILQVPLTSILVIARAIVDLHQPLLLLPTTGFVND